jgi:hypothetical protein
MGGTSKSPVTVPEPEQMDANERVRMRLPLVARPVFSPQLLSQQPLRHQLPTAAASSKKSPPPKAATNKRRDESLRRQTVRTRCVLPERLAQQLAQEAIERMWRRARRAAARRGTESHQPV